MTIFHSLIVVNVEAETSDAVIITLTISGALCNDYIFRSDQHLTLKAYLDGEELRRCYSICCSHSPSETSVVVGVIDGGCFSHYTQQDTQRGMTLEVAVPQSHFGYQPQAERKAGYLAIAAGSSTTSTMTITEAMLMTEPASQLTLIYGNHSSYRMMFCQVLTNLEDRYPQRLQVMHLLSQESMDSDLLQDRTDGDKLRALGKNLLGFSHFDDAFACGPPVMMDEVEVTLHELSITEKPIYLEHFNMPRTSVKRATGIQVEGHMAILRQGEHDRLTSLNVEDDNILDAALHQGTDLPPACKGGACVTCKCKVVGGEVAMITDYSLGTDELAASYVLSRQALLTSGDVTVDPDVWEMA